MPDGMKAKKVFIMENVDHRNLGFIVDMDNRLFVVEAGSYRLSQIPVGSYNPQTDRITVMGNVFNWTIRISNESGSRWYAIDNDDYALLGTYSYEYEQSLLSKIEAYIFPFELTFTSTTDCWAYPRVLNLSWMALILNVVLAIAMAVVYRRCRRKAITATVVTVVFGLFSFIPFMLFKD